jgi:hypothetical protein
MQERKLTSVTMLHEPSGRLETGLVFLSSAIRIPSASARRGRAAWTGCIRTALEASRFFALDRTLHSTGERLNPMAIVKGMVLVGGQTYRIVRVGRMRYEVIRILDDERVGTFVSCPKLNVQGERVDASLMVEIALTAIRGGKLSWLKSSVEK